EVEALALIAQLLLAAQPLGDVDAEDEDPRDFAGLLAQRLVEKIETPLFRRPSVTGIEQDALAVADVGLAGAIDAIEKSDVSLIDDLGDGLANGPADDGTAADKPLIRGIGEFEDVIGA